MHGYLMLYPPSLTSLNGPRLVDFGVRDRLALFKGKVKVILDICIQICQGAVVQGTDTGLDVVLCSKNMLERH